MDYSDCNMVKKSFRINQSNIFWPFQNSELQPSSALAFLSTCLQSTIQIGKGPWPSPPSRWLKSAEIHKTSCPATKITQDPAKPVSELTFPSVTICSPGLNMKAVEEAILDDFSDWFKENGTTQKRYEDQLDDFMKEKYARKPTDGSLIDQIKAMNSPPSSSDEEECQSCSSTGLQNMAACAVSDGLARRKRSIAGQLTTLWCNWYLLYSLR